jgi:hypothetical protein
MNLNHRVRRVAEKKSPIMKFKKLGKIRIHQKQDIPAMVNAVGGILKGVTIPGFFPFKGSSAFSALSAVGF